MYATPSEAAISVRRDCCSTHDTSTNAWQIHGESAAGRVSSGAASSGRLPAERRRWIIETSQMLKGIAATIIDTIQRPVHCIPYTALVAILTQQWQNDSIGLRDFPVKAARKD